MNLGQAVSICLYELRRDETAAAQPAYPKSDVASAESLERITSVLSEVLAESGYLQERTAESTEFKLRRLIRRLQINPHDSEVLLGMLRQVLWKLRSGSGR